MSMKNRFSIRYGELLLFGSLLVVFSLALYEVPEGPPGVFPKMVLIPAILVTAIRLLIVFKPDIFGTNSSGFLDFSNLVEQTEVADEAQRTFSATGSAKAIVLFLLYNLLIYAIGFTISTGLFAAILFYYFADVSLPKSVISGAICSAFVYVVFIVLLNVRPLDTYISILP